MDIRDYDSRRGDFGRTFRILCTFLCIILVPYASCETVAATGKLTSSGVVSTTDPAHSITLFYQFQLPECTEAEDDGEGHIACVKCDRIAVYNADSAVPSDLLGELCHTADYQLGDDLYVYAPQGFLYPAGNTSYVEITTVASQQGDMVVWYAETGTNLTFNKSPGMIASPLTLPPQSYYKIVAPENQVVIIYLPDDVIMRDCQGNLTVVDTFIYEEDSDGKTTQMACMQFGTSLQVTNSWKRLTSASNTVYVKGSIGTLIMFYEFACELDTAWSRPVGKLPVVAQPKDGEVCRYEVTAPSNYYAATTAIETFAQPSAGIFAETTTGDDEGTPRGHSVSVVQGWSFRRDGAAPTPPYSAYRNEWTLTGIKQRGRQMPDVQLVRCKNGGAPDEPSGSTAIKRTCTNDEEPGETTATVTKEFDPCSKLVCRNQGTCRRLDADITKAICLCSEDFYGDTCETRKIYDPQYGGVKPAKGPQAGGTKITLTGNYFKSSPVLYIGNLMCETRESTPTFVVALIPPAGDDDVNKPLSVTIEYLSEASATRHPTGFSFEYKGNPKVADINPKSSIAKGGLKLTVTGESFEVLETPILEITMNYTFRLKATPLVTTTVIKKFKGGTCDLEGNEKMRCPTPKVDFPKGFNSNTSDSDGSQSRRRRDASVSFTRSRQVETAVQRTKRQATLDDFPDPEDILSQALNFQVAVRDQEADRTLNLTENSMLGSAEDGKAVAAFGVENRIPYKIEADQIFPEFKLSDSTYTMAIKGSNLNHKEQLSEEDFYIIIGKEPNNATAADYCTVQSLTDNEVVCKPPRRKPEHADTATAADRNSDVYSVTVFLGEVRDKELTFLAGTVKVVDDLFNWTAVYIGVGVGVGVLVLAVIIGVTVYMLRRHRRELSHGNREAMRRFRETRWAQEQGYIQHGAKKFSGMRPPLQPGMMAFNQPPEPYTVQLPPEEAYGQYMYDIPRARVRDYGGSMRSAGPMYDVPPRVVYEDWTMAGGVPPPNPRPGYDMEAWLRSAGDTTAPRPRSQHFELPRPVVRGEWEWDTHTAVSGDSRRNILM